MNEQEMMERIKELETLVFTLGLNVERFAWIPVEMKVPGNYERIIMTDGTRVGEGAYYAYNTDWQWEWAGGKKATGTITHWMKMPTAPQAPTAQEGGEDEPK